MIDLSTCNEWQHRDPQTGIVMPWYTKSFLDELVTWDLSEKVVFEYGCGASSLWWAAKCEKLHGIEHSRDYADTVNKGLSQHHLRYARSWPISWFTDKETYVNYIKCLKDAGDFDIVIIDGDPVEWRDACVKPAIECLKPGGKLIIDNWLQPSVWMASEETQALLSPYPCVVYKQEGHPDWQTAVFTI